jgi:prophage antirepressor-like protein
MSSTNSLTTFIFDGKHEVRTVITDTNDDPWFVLRDVLSAMGSSTPTTVAISSIEQGLGKGFNAVIPLQTAGGVQDVTIVHEVATTFLVSRSNTEKGRQLNRWIHIEVLPSIRKTGSYSIQNVTGTAPTPKDPTLAMIVGLAYELDDAKTRIANLEGESKRTVEAFKGVSRLLNSKVEAQASVVQKHEQILSRRDPAKKFNVTHIGSILGMSARETNKLMENAGLQIGLKDTSGKAKGWELLTAGQPYGRQNQVSYTQAGSPHNASVSWSEQVVEVLLPLVK